MFHHTETAWQSGTDTDRAFEGQLVVAHVLALKRIKNQTLYEPSAKLLTGQLQASKTYVRHTETAWQWGTDRARFETHIEPNPIRAVSQLSKASYKPPAGRGAFARSETHFEPNPIQAASVPVKASKLHVRPHEAAWWDGSCDRMAARRGAYARFETRLEPNPINARSATLKQHGREGRIWPSKRCWPWLICPLWNI